MVKLYSAPGLVPAGTRVYAVGDVHGCDHRLAVLHGRIAADLAARPVARPTLVHLGDYIDRGPDSAAVVARLLGAPPAPGLAMVNLMGNHERMMLDALDEGGAAATDWLFSGGATSLASWGGDPAGRRDRWAAAIPPAHLAWLRALGLMHRVGSYLFVHAGIEPGVPLEAQDPHELLWIRNRFLHSDRDHGVVVVHGHTPQPEPEVRDNRINIDTGAVFGGPLTCAVLEGTTLGFLQS